MENANVEFAEENENDEAVRAVNQQLEKDNNPDNC